MTVNRIQTNPLLNLLFDGIRMITIRQACLSVQKADGVYRFQFENEADLREAFSGWCEQQSLAETMSSEQHDGLNVATLRH